jgi:hypothetical protein
VAEQAFVLLFTYQVKLRKILAFGALDAFLTVINNRIHRCFP